MANLKGNDLIALGFTPGKALGAALHAATHHFRSTPKEEVLAMLKGVLEDPSAYVGHAAFGKLADTLIPKIDLTRKELNQEGVPFRTYGEEMIEQGAMDQMHVAARLPVSRKAALMSDAHQGYGLPIGGVLATENSVLPYAVGMDIGCRLCLTIYEMPENYIDRHISPLKQAMLDHTKFGPKEVHERPSEHELFDRREFNEIRIIRNLKDRAVKQLGSSGGSNHFANFGEVEIKSADNKLGVAPGKYFGLMTHSGSRGLGATLAKHYTDLAMKLCVLPPEAKYLAWLDLDTQEGQEYWIAMTLAGDYASACHHDIHKRLGKAIGEKPIAMIENFHNFAWREVHDGKELIVHRKGATPAGTEDLGVIPGSMASHAFIVQGKGNDASLRSASHGAGRNFSRTEAKKQITGRMVKDRLAESNVILMGGGVDESPMAYKDIYTVMRSQADLVSIIGTFMPRIVRMAEDGSEE